jgi:hypothetical protein
MVFQRFGTSKAFNAISYALGIITLNIIITVLIFILILFFIAIESRYSDRKGYAHIEKFTSADECRKSAHGKLSMEQARLLEKDLSELDRYCASMTLITEQWSNERTYWDYHYYSQKKLSTPEINFNDVDQFNSRVVPCSADPQTLARRKTIWMFGGSTMQNMETSDQNTIANVFCKEYSAARDVTVINLGVGSFTSEMEIAKLLNLYKVSLKDEVLLPEIAIFYDGYNDAQRLMIGGSWAGLPPGVASRLAGAYSAPSPYNQTYYWATRSFYDAYTAFAGGRKNFVSDAFAELIKKLEDKSLKADHPILKKVDWRTEANGILLASRAYIHDQKVLSSVCKALNMQCFTVLQPVLPNRKTPVGKIEQTNFRSYEQSGLNQNTKRFYSEVKLASLELQNRNYHLIDLSDLPNNPKYINLPLFYDFGHGGFFTSEIIGKEMALEVLRAQRRINN